MSLRFAFRATALPVAALLLTGCASTGANAAGDPLDGRSLVAAPGSVPALATREGVRLEFGDGTLGGSLGCNHVSGRYVLDDAARLRLPTRLVMTEMACEPARMAQEERLAAFLSAGPVVSARGSQVRLRSGREVLVLVDDRRAENLPLAGTDWVLDGTVEGDVAASVPAGETAWLRLDGDRLRVRTGCSRGSATASLDGPVLQVGPLALTRARCGPAAMEVEAAMVAVLRGAVTATVQGDTLRLEQGRRGLTFRAGASGREAAAG